jgi:hypothetical protein
MGKLELKKKDDLKVVEGLLRKSKGAREREREEGEGKRR